MSQITTDLAKMIAQAPALFETLTGMKISDLMDRVPGLQAQVPPAVRHYPSPDSTKPVERVSES